MKLTVAITSANNIGLTEDCIQTIPQQYSVVIYDDASTEPVEELCRSFDVSFKGSEIPKGCTNLWNSAYEDFLKSDSDLLLITNNDILFPAYSIEEMVETFLCNSPLMLGPLSNQPGDGWNQDIKLYLSTGFEVKEGSPVNMQVIQDKLLTTIPIRERTKIDKYLCGFCFMVDRKISEFRYDEEHLIPPYIVNVGNETWLCDQIFKKNGSNGSLIICCTSFVYHYSGQTTRWCKFRNGGSKTNVRENLWR